VIMMEDDEKPPRKRKKFVDSTTLEVENESLILKKLAGGSGDALVKIFALLSSPKEKVQLERVCRRFKTLSSTPEAWSTMKQLNIETVHKCTIRINGDHINIKVGQ
jgi:hypothetical protein